MNCRTPLSLPHLPGRPFPEWQAVQDRATAAGVWRGHRLRHRLPADGPQPGGTLWQLLLCGFHGQFSFLVPHPGKDTDQGPNPVLAETRATLAAAFALLRLSPTTSGWLHLLHWLEFRLRSAVWSLKDTQQKSYIHTKQHIGQVVSVKTCLMSSSLFSVRTVPYKCKHQFKQGQISLSCFQINTNPHYELGHTDCFYKVPKYKETALLSQLHRLLRTQDWELSSLLARLSVSHISCFPRNIL